MQGRVQQRGVQEEVRATDLAGRGLRGLGEHDVGVEIRPVPPGATQAPERGAVRQPGPGQRLIRAVGRVIVGVQRDGTRGRPRCCAARGAVPRLRSPLRYECPGGVQAPGVVTSRRGWPAVEEDGPAARAVRGRHRDPEVDRRVRGQHQRRGQGEFGQAGRAGRGTGVQGHLHEGRARQQHRPCPRCGRPATGGRGRRAARPAAARRRPSRCGASGTDGRARPAPERAAGAGRRRASTGGAGRRRWGGERAGGGDRRRRLPSRRAPHGCAGPPRSRSARPPPAGPCAGSAGAAAPRAVRTRGRGWAGARHQGRAWARRGSPVPGPGEHRVRADLHEVRRATVPQVGHRVGEEDRAADVVHPELR